MKANVLKKILREILIEFVSMALTLENLKIARDMILERLYDAAENTDTQLDDWALVLVEKILSDENLAIVYKFIVDNVTIAVDGTCCKAPAVDLKPLALAIADREDGGNTCCAISLSALLQVLNILMPYLIDWYVNGK